MMTLSHRVQRSDRAVMSVAHFISSAGRGGQDVQHHIKLWLAVREAGHAVARFALNELTSLRAPPVISITIEAPHPVPGVTTMEARTRDHSAARKSLWERCDFLRLDLMADILELCAGPAALARYLYGESHFWRLRDVMLPGLTTGEIDLHTDAGQIRFLIEAFAKQVGYEPISLADIDILWRDACRLVLMEWDGIATTAKVLHRRKKMTGEEFRRVWLKNRPDAGTRAQSASEVGVLWLALRLSEHAAFLERLNALDARRSRANLVIW